MTSKRLFADEEEFFDDIVALPPRTGCVIRGDQVSKEVAERILVQTSPADEYKAEKGVESKSGTVDRRRECGILELESLHTTATWGWINWDGVVEYDADLRLSSTIRGIHSDWKKIAERFVELNLTCQLYPCVLSEVRMGFFSFEKGTRREPIEEDRPVVQFTVADGKVSLQYPGEFAVHVPQRRSISGLVLIRLWTRDQPVDVAEQEAENLAVAERLERVASWWRSRSQSPSPSPSSPPDS